MKKFDKNELKDFILGPFLLVFAFVICICLVFWLSSLTSHAASDGDGSLPIRLGLTSNYFSLSEDSLGINPEDVFDTAHSFLCTQYNIDVDEDYFIVLSDSNYNSFLTGRWRFYMVFVFNPSFPNNVTDSSNYLQQDMVFSGHIYTISYDWQYNVPSTLAYMDYSDQGIGSISLYGSQAEQINYTTDVNQVGQKSISYVPKYVVFYSGDGIYSSNDMLVLTNSARPVLNPTGDSSSVTGHSQSGYYPNVNINNLPSHPSISHNSFTTFNPPTIDTSSLEALVESLIDTISYCFDYLSSNIQSAFNSLFNNVSSLIGYIGDLLNYGFKVVQSAIDNAMQTFIDNLSSLFLPLADNVNKITTFFNNLLNLGMDSQGNFSIVTLVQVLFVPSSADLIGLINQHDTFGLVAIIDHVVDIIRTFFLTVSSIQAVHVITIPSFSFMGVTCGPYDIDFGWYSSYKALGDGIISAFLILGYIYWLFTRLPGWFRGTSSDSYTISYEAGHTWR